jgi:hypothetical protein
VKRATIAALIQLDGNGEEKHGVGLWYHWGQIAIRHEAMALDIRRDAGFWSDPELKAVMVSVASAAFAVDSFSSTIKAAIKEAPADRATKDHRHRLKALYRRAGTFDQSSLNTDIDWIIGGRDLLVHNVEGPHEQAEFERRAVYQNADAASQAVELMLRLLGGCIRAPQPDFVGCVKSRRLEELLTALEKR